MSHKQSYLYENKNYVANFNETRLSGKLCDVTIVVNGKEFRAHKIILATHLRYFASMFLNTFQESEQDVVTMQGLEDLEGHVETFISFAYTGQMLITVSNALGLLEVANYLAEDNIKESCIKFLEEHLRKEEACQAYALANSIECLKLKSVATQRILSNFEDCSQTAEFLNLDFGSFENILAKANFELVGRQEKFFEGITGWVSHDTENRRAYFNDLLSLIDITKLNPKYLLEFLGKRRLDQRDMVDDILSFYCTKTEQFEHETKNFGEKLIIMYMSRDSQKLIVQYYDFKKKKWNDPREVTNPPSNMIGPGTALNNAYYYTIAEPNKTSLHVFRVAANKTEMLISESRLLGLSAVGTCGRFLYFCGGFGNSPTNQVLRYDPLNNTVGSLSPMMTPRSSASAIFYKGCLHVLGGSTGSSYLNSVEKYDHDAKQWTTFPSMRVKRYRPALAVLGEKLYACGGETKSVEVYDPSVGRWQLVASMNKFRTTFLVVAREGKLLAIGGDSGTAEVYDPHKDEWQIDVELTTGLQIKTFHGGLICSTCED